MCLILFAYDVHPDYRLIIAANRDEFYNRPTQPLSFWNTSPGLIGGRDLQNGGTWLGMTPEGRWAAITNYREPHAQLDNAPSRGFLITNYLKNSIPTDSYLAHLQADAYQYNGFNLLLGSENDLFYFSNRKDRWLKMTSGIYGLSNRFLDSPWPKLKSGKSKMAQLIQHQKKLHADDFFEILADRTYPPLNELPETGVGLEWERILSPIFITSEAYGTRSSSVIFIKRNGTICFSEKTFIVRNDTIINQHARHIRFTQAARD